MDVEIEHPRVAVISLSRSFPECFTLALERVRSDYAEP
jgi:hypothetical protein